MKMIPIAMPIVRTRAVAHTAFALSCDGSCVTVPSYCRNAECCTPLYDEGPEPQRVPGLHHVQRQADLKASRALRACHSVQEVASISSLRLGRLWEFSRSVWRLLSGVGMTIPEFSSLSWRPLEGLERTLEGFSQALETSWRGLEGPPSSGRIRERLIR